MVSGPWVPSQFRRGGSTPSQVAPQKMRSCGLNDPWASPAAPVTSLKVEPAE